jgi:hypothetical protein
MVQGGGFEPPKLARQIYSLIPLATREPLHKRQPLYRLKHARHCNQRQPSKPGAGERNRTPDRLITSQLLYLLSYASIQHFEHIKRAPLNVDAHSSETTLPTQQAIDTFFRSPPGR